MEGIERKICEEKVVKDGKASETKKIYTRNRPSLLIKKITISSLEEMVCFWHRRF
jgi:hypothetical protein